MKKLFLIIALLVAICNCCLSQCIILDVKMNDCVSCRKNISVLKDLSSELPIYAVFSERMRDDSLDIDYKLSLNHQHIRYIFNNKYYKKFHKADTSSNWYVLDQNGATVMEGDLKTMDGGLLTDSIRNLIDLLPVGRNNIFDFTKDRIFTYNSSINKVQILLKKDLRSVVNIRSRDFDFKQLVVNLPYKDSIAFLEKGLALTSAEATGFKPGFTWFDISPADELYVLMEYIQPFGKGTSFEYESETCLVKYDNEGKVRSVFPLNYDSARRRDNYTAEFSFKNKDTFLTITHYPNSWFHEELERYPDGKIEFITDYTFDQKDRTYKPVKYYPVDLPMIYRKKYEENFLSPDLCAYPYIAFTFSNELFDLNTNQHCDIILPSQYDSHVNLDNKELGKEQYKVLGLGKLSGGLLVAYRLDSDVYLKYFTEDLRAGKTVKVGQVLEGRDIFSCYIDSYAAQVYFTFEGEANVLSVPLGLYGF